MVKFNWHVYLAKSVSPLLDTNTVPLSGGDGFWHAADTKLRNRGSYMSAHVLLNLLNELGKRDKM